MQVLRSLRMIGSAPSVPEKDQEDPAGTLVQESERMLAHARETGAEGSLHGAPAPELMGRDAFDALIQEHLPVLHARAVQLCRRQGDPDDLVQDAIERALRKRSQVKDPTRIRGWLLTILTNTFLDRLRRRRGRDEVPLDTELPAPVIDAPSPWELLSVDDVRAAVAELPDDVRDTYRRFALCGEDYVNISAALGVPKATVGTRISRARKRLRALLVARLGDRHA